MSSLEERPFNENEHFAGQWAVHDPLSRNAQESPTQHITGLDKCLPSTENVQSTALSCQPAASSMQHPASLSICEATFSSAAGTRPW
eukprot:6484605-Amphidinium_carterae.1